MSKWFLCLPVYFVLLCCLVLCRVVPVPVPVPVPVRLLVLCIIGEIGSLEKCLKQLREAKHMKPLWKVKGFEKPATWKESVPDCTPTPTHCTPKHQPHTHRTPSKSMSVRTRKMTFSWWLVAILTCKSFVTIRSARFPQESWS